MTTEKQTALEALERLIANLDMTYNDNKNDYDLVRNALTAQIEAPAEDVREAVKNLRDLMKHGSANGAIEVWVQYDHPVKLARLSHVDCETIIRAATAHSETVTSIPEVGRHGW